MRRLKLFIILFLFFCAPKKEKKIFLLPSVPKPLDVLLLLDQSGSMKETDPQNNRIEAGKFLIDYLSSYWAKEQDHRIGLINFGDTSANPKDEIGELTSLDTANKTAIENLKQKIKPLNLGNTKFIDAFQKAEREFSAKKDEISRQKVIILLTDGEPDDKRGWTRERYFNEIINYFQNHLADCHLYVLGIDIPNRYWSYNEPYWRKIAKYTERLISVEEKNLKEAFWRVISMEMEAVAEKWFLIPPEGFKVFLDPYLEKVTFTFHREFPDAEVTIYDPKGKKIEEKPPKIDKIIETPKTIIWKIEEPMPGEWLCKIEKGAGRVEVGAAQIPIQPRLIYPKEIHPLGKPFVIWASFLRKDGRPIKEHRAYALKMGASLLYPGETNPVHFDLKETKEVGIFKTMETVYPNREGEYQIILEMTAHKPIIETLIPIKVRRIPYIEVLKPIAEEVQPWHKDLIIEVELKIGENPMNPLEEFINDPNSMFFYQIFDVENNEIIKSGHLRCMGGEREVKFSANAGKIKKNGKYRLIIKFRGEKKEGTVYEYTTNPNGTIFYKKMDFIDFVIYRPYILALIILLVVFFWDWQRIGRENGWWGWRINCPQLMGELQIVTKISAQSDETSKEEQTSPSGEKKTEKEETQPTATEEIWSEPQIIFLKGRKKRIKELGIILYARREKVKEDDEVLTKTKIYIHWEKIEKPDEELVACEEKDINDKAKIHYFI